MDRVDVQLKFRNKWFRKLAVKLASVPRKGENFKVGKGSATEFVVTHVRWTMGARPEIQCAPLKTVSEAEEEKLAIWLLSRRWKSLI